MKYKDMLFDGKLLDLKVYLDSLIRIHKFINDLHYYSIDEFYNALFHSGLMNDYANVMDFIILLNLGYFKIIHTDFDLDLEVYLVGRKE